MRKSILFLVAFLISTINTSAQWPNYSCTINFEDNPCWEGSYYHIDYPGTNNIWQVCIPHKSVFDSAFSAPYAILTDSTGQYPVNNTSSFIIKFVLNPYCMCAPAIGGRYKFDSDSLKDYGQLDISFDNGVTWTDALKEDSGLLQWYTPKPVFTGRIHQWREFSSLFVGGGTYKQDTIWYRYTFVSDSIQTNQEGWMLDNIQLIAHTEGIQDDRYLTDINIYPNPATDKITIEIPGAIKETNLAIVDIEGQQLITWQINELRTQIDISSLPGGVYFVRLTNNDTVEVGKFVKE
jgi:hypothetical protein